MHLATSVHHHVCHACMHLPARITHIFRSEVSRRTPSECAAPCKESDLYSCANTLAVTSRTDRCFISHSEGGGGGAGARKPIPAHSVMYAGGWAADTCYYIDRKWHLMTCPRGIGRVRAHMLATYTYIYIYITYQMKSVYAALHSTNGAYLSRARTACTPILRIAAVKMAIRRLMVTCNKWLHRNEDVRTYQGVYI